MARQNLAFLVGAVMNPPNIIKQDGRMLYGLTYINVVRSDRDVGDGITYMRQASIPLITRSPAVLEEMATWKLYDIVEVKGVLSQSTLTKSSWCPYCGTKNSALGDCVYVNPIFAMYRTHCDTPDACKEYLAAHREISNQIYLFGVLCQKPVFVRTKRQGITYLQFPLAVNRRFRIKEDPQTKKSDYVWVKAYGKDWTEPLTRELQIGSEIYVLGSLQMRNVMRHRVCGQAYQDGKPVTIDGQPYIPYNQDTMQPCGCGRHYVWRDQTLEVVPYKGGIEYLFRLPPRERELTNPSAHSGDCTPPAGSLPESRVL